MHYNLFYCITQYRDIIRLGKNIKLVRVKGHDDEFLFEHNLGLASPTD